MGLSGRGEEGPASSASGVRGHPLVVGGIGGGGGGGRLGDAEHDADPQEEPPEHRSQLRLKTEAHDLAQERVVAGGVRGELPKERDAFSSSAVVVKGDWTGRGTHLIVGHLVDVGEEQENEARPRLAMRLRQRQEVLEPGPADGDQPLLHLPKKVLSKDQMVRGLLVPTRRYGSEALTE